jgi:hypothetical protein
MAGGLVREAGMLKNFAASFRYSAPSMTEGQLLRFAKISEAALDAPRAEER